MRSCGNEDTFTAIDLGTYHDCWQGDCDHESNDECVDALCEHIADLTHEGKDLQLKLWRLQAKFIELRNAWFEQVLLDRCPLVLVSDADHVRARIHNENKQLKAEFDKQTDALLKDVDCPVAPTCAADMETRMTRNDK